jgi:2-polyprenyl-3-methyl-5-hydroxy-6-metoxy-1,4-benzoquinol methylase
MSNPYALNLSSYSTHSIIINNIGKNKKVLDIGCNDGYIGKDSDTTNTFYGLDYLQESVNKAKEVYKDAMLYDLNNLKELSWNKKFDTLIFADVLEHVLYPEEALDFFVNNYLKKGGRVIISLPNIANWQIRLNLLLGRFNYTETGIMDKTHLHFYTFKTAKELIEKRGLTIYKGYGGATFFGRIIKRAPFLNGLLATNFIWNSYTFTVV